MPTERIKLSDMNPAPYNPRRDLQPEDEAYQALEKSLNEYGCVQGIVWNRRSGNIVGGHQTYKILLAHGETEADAFAVDLASHAEKALNIALNEIHGARDTDKLSALLKELNDFDSDLLELMGISGKELDKLLGSAEQTIVEMGEIAAEAFGEDAFEHTCPRCGFKFNG